MNKNHKYLTSKPTVKIVEKTILTPDIGKLPPQARELEEAVLGALMLEKEAYPIVSDMLEPESFYDPIHKIVYGAIQSLASQRKPIDVLTVVEELKRQGALESAGGAIYVAELSEKVASAAHIEYHARIIAQKATARKLISQSCSVMDMAFDETVDVEDTIEFLEQSFTELRTNKESADCIEMNAAIKKTLEYLTDVQQKAQSGESVSIPTGLTALDNSLNGGWSAPDLIVIGARPGGGKTQFALHFAKNAARNGKHCLFVSIEMTVEQLVMRYLIEDDRLSYKNMKSGQMSHEEWRCLDEVIAGMRMDKLSIADISNIGNLNNIKSLARKQKRAGKLDMLIIDYLQLIKTNQSFGTRDIEIGHITRELKGLAKELNIPVIILAQLSRPEKSTRNYEPNLPDLRESGNIEQDADTVIFPCLPSQWYANGAKDNSGEDWKNRGYLKLAKRRDGVRDEKIHFQHDDRFKKISDYQQPFKQVVPCASIDNYEKKNEQNELPF